MAAPKRFDDSSGVGLLDRARQVLEVAKVNGDVMLALSTEDLERLLVMAAYTQRRRQKSRAKRRMRRPLDGLT